MRVFVTGIGIISPLGNGLDETVRSLRGNISGIRPLTLFPSVLNLPAGQVSAPIPDNGIPRTHRIAIAAAREALRGRKPGAIILGTTTGGMQVTENLLRQGIRKSEEYAYHSTGSVAEYLARETGCTGEVMTVSTACSSGTVALAIALELMRAGKAARVLAGGADSLCRLTYYGFNSLQLIDPGGSRPFDRDRRGMTVAEGAAMLLLEASDDPPGHAMAELLGAGLSCDAHHPASPHPEGEGARNAMASALDDAGIPSGSIEYINLHGTGTLDNDLAEAKAVKSLFGDHIPLLSSTKGAFGHTLGAAGAIEAAVSIISIAMGLVPANTGCVAPDPALGITPVLAPLEKKIRTALSNLFGFGGNNASVIFGGIDEKRGTKGERKPLILKVCGVSCITGAGDAGETLAALGSGRECRGMLTMEQLSKRLPPRDVRRLKRLPRMALALADEAVQGSQVTSVFFGTGWGALSETCDFLVKLFESNEQFTSPTDFVGSVHNAPAGQIAIRYRAKGANVTTTGGDCTFEQALLAASLLLRNEGDTALIIGADEYQSELTPLLDRSSRKGGIPSDGGGAILVKASSDPAGLRIAPLFCKYSNDNDAIIDSLANELGPMERYGALFAGIPAEWRGRGDAQLSRFLAAAGNNCPVMDYRAVTGEHASASAVAAAIAALSVSRGLVPGIESHKKYQQVDLGGRGILILGLGDFITAFEVMP